MLRRQAKDEGSATSGEWMVTFSDCMTLLLTFFVMLLSFSSFDPITMNRILGALNEPSQSSLLENKRLPRESPVRDEREVDRTEDGSDQPDLDQLEPVDKPRDPLEYLTADAYRDRRVLTVPSEMLFWAQGAQFKPHARELLGHVADFLRLVPCRVIVSETVATPQAQDRALARASAVVGHLTEAERLAADRFGIAVQVDPALRRPDAKPAVRIAMLSQKVYP
ncbi:MAG: hypothetical protein AMS14_01585 [Planctomycetes bacterium DG_20]|nr:MAG: hypothetical protein AMS14_01585 [Planctomycetes bacterium DG_20]